MAGTHSSLVIVLLVVCAAASVPQALAAQTADSVYTIGEITVTSSREGVRPARAAQRINVLDAQAIASTASRSVADVLAARSSLFIRRQGQGLATVSQRGAGPSQAQLMIDGMRLADPQLGQFDLSLLPTHLFQSVEILHGPGSALYGTDGMSGIIHLRARRGESDRLSALTEAGAFGERLASAGLSFERGGLSGLVSAEFARTNGDFPYVNRALFPPREVRRQNADRHRGSLFGTLQGRAGRHNLRGAMLYVDARQGLPGLAGSASQDERRWDEHARFWLEDRLPIRDGAVHLRAFAHRGALRYRNPALELDDTGRTLTSGLEAEYQAPVGSSVNATAGASAGYGSADHPSLSVAASEFHAAAFASAAGSFGPLRLYPALRVDTYRLPDRRRSALSPRLGANLQVSRRVPVFLKLNAASGFRTPTFNDRFWQPGGDPGLKPERSRSFDAGTYLDGSALRVELSGFVAHYANQIVWTAEAGDYWSPENMARTVSKGFEASVDARPHDMFTMGALYAFTHAVDRSRAGDPSYGRQLRYVPRHHAKAYASAELGPVRLDVGGRYLGRRYVTGDQSEWLEASFVADAQAGLVRRIGPLRARVSVVVENLLDARYAVIQGYPMPPRHARIRLLLETL